MQSCALDLLSGVFSLPCVPIADRLRHTAAFAAFHGRNGSWKRGRAFTRSTATPPLRRILHATENGNRRFPR
jgi:hypothetical protein